MRFGSRGLAVRTFLGFCVIVGAPAVFARAATTAATYQFDNTFAANEAGAPALIPTDPQGTSAFQTDTVLGQSRRVWAFNGVASPPDQQAGVTVNTTGLVAPQSYSVDMVFQFSDGANAWRRIIDVQNRQSDAGFYVDPGNNLDVYPVSGSSAAWSNNVYHHVVLTDDGTTVKAYLDGVSQFSTTTNLLNLDVDPVNNPNRLMGFFLDNVAGGGQGEWSPGKVALIRLWNGVLTDTEAQQLANNPFIPEPGFATVAGLTTIATLLRGRRNRGR